MTFDRKDRRDFLRRMGCLAASGSAMALIPQLRMLGTALAATNAFSDYKALVCVYLAGGNDGWNTLVPLDARYSTYINSRSGIYVANNDPHGRPANPGGLALDTTYNYLNSANPLQPYPLLPLTGASGSGSSAYALHPALPELQSLYDSQNLALVVNAGTLRKPITKTDYNTVSNRPPQLYSHSDQENLWHVGTSVDNVNGWGGQVADQVKSGNALASLSPCISISGSNKFEVGPTTIPYQMSSGGLSSLSGVCNPTCSGNASVRDTAFNALLNDTYSGELYAAEYGKIFQRGRSLYGTISGGLAGANGTLATVFPNTSLANQLKMVARMIKLSRANSFQYANRQIFYVRFGSFDLHSGLMATGNSGHYGLLTQVSQALNAFWNALVEIGAQNDVTAFTMSEFARTLSSNGNGSDHGWGGVQMVLGGSVHGGQLYTDGGGPITGFPNQLIDGTSNNTSNPMAFGRGQTIPGIGTEQYAATLAQWMGVPAGSLSGIFPNLPQFGTSTLGFI